MTYQLYFVIASVVFEWLLVSAGLFLVSGKLKWEQRWKAWIPGLRFKKLGDSLFMNKTGTNCGILDVLFIISVVFRVMTTNERFVMAASLFHLIMFVFMLLYKIQLYVRLNQVFGLSKKWLILWIAINWIPLMIVGGGKKYQPDMEMLRDEDWEESASDRRDHRRARYFCHRREHVCDAGGNDNRHLCALLRVYLERAVQFDPGRLP